MTELNFTLFVLSLFRRRKKKEVAKEKPRKPTNQEELERNQEKMALHSSDPKFIAGDSEQGRVLSDNRINL